MLPVSASKIWLVILVALIRLLSIWSLTKQKISPPTRRFHLRPQPLQQHIVLIGAKPGRRPPPESRNSAKLAARRKTSSTAGVASVMPSDMHTGTNASRT